MKRRAGLLAVFIFWCAVLAKGENLVASISDQEIALLDRGKVLARCPISTSKFGLGEEIGRYRTPMGEVERPLRDFLPAEQPSLLVRSD
jgi:hypothetical protein